MCAGDINDDGVDDVIIRARSAGFESVVEEPCGVWQVAMSVVADRLVLSDLDGSQRICHQLVSIKLTYLRCMRSVVPVISMAMEMDDVIIGAVQVSDSNGVRMTL